MTLKLYYTFFYRIGNKIEYLNVGLRKIIHPPCKNLQHGVRLEVDGKLVVLPQLEGLIILNILRYMFILQTFKKHLVTSVIFFKVGDQELNHGVETATKNNSLRPTTGMVC